MGSALGAGKCSASSYGRSSKNPVSIEYELGEGPIYFGQFGEKYFGVAGNPIKTAKNEDDAIGPLKYQLSIVGFSNSKMSCDDSVFWDVMLCGWVNDYGRFGRFSCLHI
jgi:hypothetical protein